MQSLFVLLAATALWAGQLPAGSCVRSLINVPLSGWSDARFRERITRSPGLLRALPWSEALTLATSPDLPESARIREALSDAIALNPASMADRRALAADVLRDPKRPEWIFMDEILGLPARRLIREERESCLRVNKLELFKARECGMGGDYGDWLTNYFKLWDIAKLIHERKLRHVVDLGAGTARLGLLLGVFFPEVRFTGIEIQPSRVAAAREVFARWTFPDRIQMLEQNLLDPDQPWPKADGYYIYGPTHREPTNEAVVDRLLKTKGRYLIFSTYKRTTTFLAEHSNTACLRSKVEGLAIFEKVGFWEATLKSLRQACVDLAGD